MDQRKWSSSWDDGIDRTSFPLEPSEMTFFLRRSWPTKPYTGFIKYSSHDANRVR